MSAPDRRLTPATERVALIDSGLTRPTLTNGQPARVAVALTELCREPDGARDRQLRMGADVLVIDALDGWSFVRAEADRYCGWVRSGDLTTERPPITHRVMAPATHIYPGPNLKLRETARLSLGARVSGVDTDGKFVKLAQGGWVPAQHLRTEPANDPATVALALIGTPYLWGGNSREGIDCSGLVQTAMHACALACPGDADLQERAFPPATGPIQRGDLLFWKGHVAMALDEQRMIHATAFAMSVIIEDIEAALKRIEAAGDGDFLGVRRPQGQTIAFP